MVYQLCYHWHVDELLALPNLKLKRLLIASSASDVPAVVVIAHLYMLMVALEH